MTRGNIIRHRSRYPREVPTLEEQAAVTGVDLDAVMGKSGALNTAFAVGDLLNPMAYRRDLEGVYEELGLADVSERMKGLTTDSSNVSSPPDGLEAVLERRGRLTMAAADGPEESRTRFPRQVA